MSQQQATEKDPITRSDVFQSFLRWLFFSHANYNWERYQATGFAHAMTPIIKKLYKDPEDIKAALKRHLVFFNTEPDTGGLIHGMVIAMEEQRAIGAADIDDETINNVKIGLMGPFAGLGDVLKQGLWFPIWQSIGISVAIAAEGGSPIHASTSKSPAPPRPTDRPARRRRLARSWGSWRRSRPGRSPG